jgi:hypothetical protein
MSKSSLRTSIVTGAALFWAAAAKPMHRRNVRIAACTVMRPSADLPPLPDYCVPEICNVVTMDGGVYTTSFASVASSAIFFPPIETGTCGKD